VFFQKTIYKVKLINLKKFRLYKVSWKVATCVRKSFYSKILTWQKVSHQEKKNWKSANLSKCTDPLKYYTFDIITYDFQNQMDTGQKTIIRFKKLPNSSILFFKTEKNAYLSFGKNHICLVVFTTFWTKLLAILFTTSA
jgi:hypothetical protein